jgi:hypothetical protein
MKVSKMKSPESYESDISDVKVYEDLLDYVKVNELEHNTIFKEALKRLKFLAHMSKCI